MALPTRTSVTSWLTAAAVFIGTGAAAFVAYERGIYEPPVFERGAVTVTTARGRDAGRTVTAPTRLVTLSSTRRSGLPEGTKFWEVKLSSGRWVRCEKSCAERLRSSLDP